MLWHSSGNLIMHSRGVFLTPQLSDDGETSDANAMPRVNVGARSRDKLLALIFYLIYLHAFTVVKPYLRVVGRPGVFRLVIPLSRH